MMLHINKQPQQEVLPIVANKQRCDNHNRQGSNKINLRDYNFFSNSCRIWRCGGQRAKSRVVRCPRYSRMVMFAALMTMVATVTIITFTSMCQYLQSIVYTRFRPIIHTTTQATQQATTGQIVHVITPTYTRDTQLCDLTRLSQALAVAAGAGTRVQWIIVEDRATKSILVKRFVYDTQVMAKSHFGGAGIPLTLVHLAVAEKRVRGRFKAGTQRNAAIEYILTHKEVPVALLPLKTHSSSSAIVDTASESRAPKRAKDNNIKSKPKLHKPSVAGVNHDVSSITATTSSDTATRSDDGVVLFIDDDNAIDHRLLSAASGITSVGVWAVGYSGARRVEYPIVNATSGRVTNFHSWSPAFRASYPVDMAAFGVAVSLLERNKAARFEPLAPASTGEVRFLTAVGVPWSRLETLPDALKSKVLVWHVHTRARVDAAHINDGRGLFRYV